jgi:arsenical pump membrane protein
MLAAALVLFCVTLALVVWRPWGLGIGWSALIGAGLALLTGIVPWRAVPLVWGIVWDATFTFVGLIVIALVLDEAGFFHWAALHVVRWGGRRGRRLFPLIVLLGAAVSAGFANDGAALILTPIVLAILLRLEFPPPAAFAFVIASGFVADTTSLPLMISNLINIINANYFGIGFDRYALVMVPVDLVALAATLGVLGLYFRKAVPRRYELERLDPPSAAIRDPLVFRASFPILGVLLLAYLVTAPLGLPVSVVTGAATLVLLALAGRWHRGGRGAMLPLKKILHEAPWSIVVFSLGMYVVVYGLGQAGLTELLRRALVWCAEHGVVAASLGTGFLSAFLSSVMNNLPATLLGALALHRLPAAVPDSVRSVMVYANVIGCDLGPKFTPIGSLATLLWLHVLDRKGVHVGWKAYMKTGIVLTPAVLAATLLALAVWLPLVR